MPTPIDGKKGPCMGNSTPACACITVIKHTQEGAIFPTNQQAFANCDSLEFYQVNTSDSQRLTHACILSLWVQWFQVQFTWKIIKLTRKGNLNQRDRAHPWPESWTSDLQWYRQHTLLRALSWIGLWLIQINCNTL